MNRLTPLIPLMLATAASCSPAQPLIDPGPAPSPKLVVPSRSPSSASPSPSAVTTASTSARPSASPSSRASSAPGATPSPQPSRLESRSFFLNVPASWRVQQGTLDPEGLLLVADYAGASFKVETERTNVGTLKSRQERAVSEAGPGLVSNTTGALDQVSGFSVTSNQDLANGGKVYVIQRGFIYRATFFKLTASWDKRSADSDRVDREVKAIISSFKWL